MEKKIATPPFPIYGRIPNFKGSKEAALKLTRIREWVHSLIVKINPDSPPQRNLRHLALIQGKNVVMLTPRIKKWFPPTKTR